MNARQELAEVIANFRDDWYKVERKSPAGIDRDEAKAILAAGYSKPRTITTAEELAEAHMVVVRTEAGTIANLVNGRAYCFGYEASAPVATLALPVTVLWEREAAA